MIHPSKAQAQTVIDTFKKAYELGGGDCPVDMSRGIIKFKHPCGAPMCHGAYYGLATGKEGDDYGDAAQQMAKDLGFSSVEDLKLWARDNDNIWGTRYGGDMFSSDRAFTGDDNIRLTSLLQIITHWEGVQSRLPE